MSGDLKGKSVIKDNNIEKVHKIKYDLIRPQLDWRTKLATSSLKMPSDEGLPLSMIADQKNFPPVVLDVKAKGDEHCLYLMKTCPHKNILHARTVTEGSEYLAAWTEPYTGCLLDYLKKMPPKGLGCGDLRASLHVIPSDKLKDIVSQIIDGLNHLRLFGHYHGNFGFEKTYYYLDSGKPIVKLTNFKKKDGKSLPECHIQDCHDLGDALGFISEMANQHNMSGHKPPLDCCQINDLAEKLKNVSREDIDLVMANIKKHVFFWNESDRKKFFVYDIAQALKCPSFRSKIEACCLFSVPWDGNVDDRLLQVMNSYRETNGQPTYDGNSRAQFLAFCSGAYTHENELDLQQYQGRSVDQYLQRLCPRLCFESVSQMPDRQRKYLAS